MSWPGRLGLAATVVAGGLAVLNAALEVVSFDARNLAYTTVAALVSVPALVMGRVVLRHAPDNVVGALLCCLAILPNLATYGDTYAAVLERRPGSLPVNSVVVATGGGAWVLLFLPTAVLLLVFPTGRLPSRRWRWVVGGLLAAGAGIDLVIARAPGPYPAPYAASPHVFGQWSGTGWVVVEALNLVLLAVLLALVVASVLAPVQRYRRSTSTVERAQLTWFALAGGLLPAALVLCWVGWLLFDTGNLVVVGLALLFVAIPVATAVAITRHDLYDVNRLASAAVTYSVVTVVLLAVFTAATAGVGAVLGHSSPAAAATVTAAAAVLLAPLRRRVQRRVDGRLYPARQNTLRALEEFRIRSHAGLARPEDLEDVLRRSLDEPGLRVGYLVPGSVHLVDSHGEPLPDPISTDPVISAAPPVAVTLGARRIGALTGAVRCSPALLQEAAAAAALPVEVARLRIEVSEALREVEASRRRLQQAGYDERRRLERDLHDGAQQRLVSLGMAIRVAQRHLGDGPSMSTACWTRRSPSSPRRSPNSAGWRTGSVRAASMTGCRPRC